ncbi:RNA polymerase sigma factor [Pseudalkalibacillus hwajinpoensis]|uniref:RNA polymerase sigma factor n=1 Tax=Guptibacillus hwajinpoensis TaxID=208199 RepID=A0A4U1MGF4_9BACL|nr:RNA polymerase sigma factor [Pseudalkalibacillus hwajinpoensis]TKD69963.1 RNA polymerase sigma factor [Pseudalkalibacillus hwajinpoensis]
MEMTFHDLYTQHYNRVYYSAIKVTKDHGLAEDVLQETFITAHVKLMDIDNEAKVGSWLSTVATRKAIDLLRKKKKVVLVSIDSSPQLTNLPLDFTVEKECENAQLEEGVGVLICALSPKLRSVFQLYYHHQLKEKEIASKLQLSPGAVKSRLHRARIAMKSKMINEFQHHDTA